MSMIFNRNRPNNNRPQPTGEFDQDNNENRSFPSYISNESFRIRPSGGYRPVDTIDEPDDISNPAAHDDFFDDGPSGGSGTRYVPPNDNPPNIIRSQRNFAEVDPGDSFRSSNDASKSWLPDETAERKLPTKFNIYRIDFTAVNCGLRISTSKRRLRWRFGFTNLEALETGRVGAACRGQEHDVTIMWSVTSGKAIILNDGQIVHQLKNRVGTLQHTWRMRGNHVLKVVAKASPALTPTPGFRQYDFFVDGQSFFKMPQVYELGNWKATMGQPQAMPVYVPDQMPPVNPVVPIRQPPAPPAPVAPQPPVKTEEDTQRKIEVMMSRVRVTEKTEYQPAPLLLPAPPVESHELVPANVYSAPPPPQQPPQPPQEQPKQHVHVHNVQHVIINQYNANVNNEAQPQPQLPAPQATSREIPQESTELVPTSYRPPPPPSNDVLLLPNYAPQESTELVPTSYRPPPSRDPLLLPNSVPQESTELVPTSYRPPPSRDPLLLPNSVPQESTELVPTSYRPPPPPNAPPRLLPDSTTGSTDLVPTSHMPPPPPNAPPRLLPSSENNLGDYEIVPAANNPPNSGGGHPPMPNFQPPQLPPSDTPADNSLVQRGTDAIASGHMPRNSSAPDFQGGNNHPIVQRAADAVTTASHMPRNTSAPDMSQEGEHHFVQRAADAITSSGQDQGGGGHPQQYFGTPEIVD